MRSELRLAVGSYTAATGGHGIGITQLAGLTDGTGLRVISSAPCASPSYLVWSMDGRTLYAAHETTPGTISSWHVRSDGTLALSSARGAGGGRPCHLALHPSGTFLVAANYGSGSYTSFPLNDDGTLGLASSSVRHIGQGPHPTRQNRSHPHTVIFSPDGQWAILLDVGLDTLSVHQVDPVARALKQDPRTTTATSPGSGPRHAEWLSPLTLAVVEEITSTVSIFHWTGSNVDGPTATAPSSTGAAADAWPSEIQRLSEHDILVGNRKRGLLSRLDFSDGRLSSRGDLALPSPNVRHFWASENIAFIALQDSNQVASINLSSGQIIDSIAVSSPAYIAAAPNPRQRTETKETP